MTEDFPPLPSLPAGLSETGAGLWLASALMQSAIDRGWDSEQLRKAVVLTLVNLALNLDDNGDRLLHDVESAIAQVQSVDSTHQ